MAFVYQKIGDEDRRRIDFSKIKVSGEQADSKFWAIDREQNAFLVWGYPEREPPYYRWFAYWSTGKIYEVAVLEKERIKNDQGKWILRREIKVALPPGISLPNPEVNIEMKNITEAIKAYVYGVQVELGRQSEVAEIQVERIKQGE